MIDNSVNERQAGGMAAGLLACTLAVLGTLTQASALLPLGFFTATFGLVQGVKGRSLTCVVVNLLACGIALFGVFTAPAL